MNIELNNTDLIKKQGVNTGSMDGRAVQASHVAVDV
jgi:hypothetical protein